MSPLFSPLGTVSSERKRRKAWSNEEVAAIRTGVAEYGEGQWVAILNRHGDVFSGRTNVDIKDKWRNMKKLPWAAGATPGGLRQPRRLWSADEVEALRNGVRILGEGNWSAILKLSRDTFTGRTSVNLKDKWRNMNK